MPFPFIYLAAYLEKNGFKCGIIDIKSKETIVDEARIGKVIEKDLHCQAYLEGTIG